MVLVTDFDNTLYSNSNSQVLKSNLQASKAFRQSGNKFVLATGRNASSLGRVLPDFYKYFDYIILNNGAVCVDQNNKTMFQYTIPEEVAQNISQSISKQYQDEVVFVYYQGAKEWTTLSHDLTKLRCWTTDAQIGENVLKMVNQNYSNQVQSFLDKEAFLSGIQWIDDSGRFHSFVDIMSKDAGKKMPSSISLICFQTRLSSQSATIQTVEVCFQSLMAMQCKIQCKKYSI